MKSITILIPTYNRPSALATTLTSLAFQEEKDFDIVISNQSTPGLIEHDSSVTTAIRVLEKKGHRVNLHTNLPAKGMAHQRQFLLDNSNSPYSLYLDDDLILEPFVIKNMRETLEKEGCGFVGCAVIGLSFRNDIRPHQQQIEFWDGKIEPETIVPKGKEWKRYELHNAANIMHVEENLNIKHDFIRKYKVAWVGGCVMYDTQKLMDVGGFNFWQNLPEKHCGEDVLAQLRVMKKYGGCGIIPSGVYHQEHPTTIPERKINAPEYLEI